jgi:hypothetical protein
MNDVCKTNKQTNKQRSPFEKESKMPPGRIFFGFHLYTGKEEDQLLFDGMETLRGKDRKTRSEFIRFALAEYVGRHLPSGNPQLDIRVYGQVDPVPLSEAAKEKLAPQNTDSKPTPNYAEMSTENLVALYSHPWKLEGFDRQLVAHILKSRGVDLEKIKKEA